MAGRLETPPAPYRLTPGMSDSRLAVSLVADRRGARAALSSRVAPGAVLSSLESLTVTAGRARVLTSAARALLHSRHRVGTASDIARGVF
jgi:hypothetical protein